MPTVKAIRSFVAVELPSTLRSQLMQVSRQLESSIPPGAVRWVRPEGIHLTLKFLGDVSPGQMPAIQGLAKTAAGRAQPCVCAVRGLGCFPGPRRPRVIWIGIEDPTGTLVALQQALEQGLAELGFAREGRPFNPHLTLGRVRPEAGSAAEQIRLAIEAAGEVELSRLEARSLCLFRSDLRPGGAIYTRMGEFALGGEA